MDDLRELDARCAELLGWKTQPACRLNGKCSVGWAQGGVLGYDSCYEHLPCINMTEPPRYSSDPAACAELDGEARQEGFTLYLWYDRHGVWVACYLREDEQPNWLIWEFGDTEWEARVKAFIAAKERTDRAVVRALEGSGEK